MTLFDICKMIAEIEEGLMYGEIDFYYDNLMCVMKPGHPADLLDKALSLIGWDVFQGKDPSTEKILETYEQLKMLKATFRIKELKKPIDALEEYLYPSTLLTFPIEMEGRNNCYVEYTVTSKELKKITSAMEKGCRFEEAPGLKGFYTKLRNAARKQLAEDVEFYVNYPITKEEESNG